MSTATISKTETQTRPLGYHDFAIGQFTFKRDEYFSHIGYPGGIETADWLHDIPLLAKDGWKGS